MKVNFDGASFGNPGPAAYGCVVTDSQGIIILAKGRPIGIADTLHAEMMGLLEVLHILKQKREIFSVVQWKGTLRW